jgi:hypothetical protein
MVQVTLEQSDIAESNNSFLLSEGTAIITTLTKFPHSIMFTISSPARTRSSFDIIIPYVLTYTRVVSSLEHFDKKYE